jgi:hypothetical protein
VGLYEAVKDVAKLAQQADNIDLYRRLLDLSAQALDMQDEISKLKNENAELKCFIRDLIYENHNLCFQFSNTTCLFNSEYKNRAEELIGEKL